MDFDYQLRKDIDKILNSGLINDAVTLTELKEELAKFYDISEVEEISSKLRKDLNKLSNDLTDLNKSIESFNTELTELSEDNITFQNNLTTLQSNLTTVIRDVTQLKEDASQLKTDIDGFDSDLTELSNNLDGLTNDLEILSTYLTTFEGDLTQFQNKLKTDLGTTEYNKLNSDLIKLVGAITNVKKRTTATEGNITTVQGDITNNIKPDLAQVIDDVGDNNSGLIKDVNDLETLIGNPTDTGTSTIYGNINTTQNHIDTVNNYLYGTGTSSNPSSGSIMYKINNILNVDIPAVESDINDFNIIMYGSASGSTSNYTSTSMYGRIQSLLTRISEAEENIGSVDLTKYGDLANQNINSYSAIKNLLHISVEGTYNKVLICYETPTNHFANMSIDITDLGYSYLDFEYVYDAEHNKLYKSITTHPTDPDITGYHNLQEISSVSLIGSVGICANLNHTSFVSKEPYDLIYEVYSNTMYIKKNNKWINSNDINDYLEYTPLYKWLNTKYLVANQMDDLVNMIYPRGSIYMSVNSTSPEILFGGTWERLEDTFLFATCGTADTGNTATDGEKTHTLTIDEMPSHNHTQEAHRHGLGMRYSSGTGSSNAQTNQSNRTAVDWYTDSQQPTINNTGGSQAHNNMPPYMNVYMWKRIA